MGATYTRQSSYSDGDTITAAHTNDEFNQLLAAFASSSGHTHDGTSAEGGPITKLLGTAITIGDGTSGTDIAVTFDGESADGVLTWMEDEDYFKFSDDILINSTEKLYFNDTGTYIFSNADGDLDLVADGTNADAINLASSGGITLDAAADISLDVGGADVVLKDDGTTFGALTQSGGELVIKSGSSSTTAMTLSGANVTFAGTVTIGSAGISEAELEILDGATVTTAELNILDGVTATTAELNYSDTGSAVGTVVASKVVTVDSNKDVASFRNITLTGELDAGSLDVSGDADIDGTLEADAITVGGTALNTVIAGVTVTNATTAAVATTVTISDNESTNEENAIIFTAGGDVDGGNIGLESDGDLAYNPSTGTVTATIFKGNVDAVDGDFDGTLEADAITVGGTALNTVIAGVTVTNSTNSAHVLVTDNESTDEENLIAFVEGATSSTGNVGLEMDGHLTYNPSTGTVSATVFKGNIDAVDGDFDGTLEADAITLDGTAITATATLSTGISNNNVPKFTSGVADNDFLRVDGTAIEGRSASEVLSDIGASAAAGSSSIVTTGALDAGSITSNFGTINNGASTITTTGAVNFGAATVDSLDVSDGNITNVGSIALDSIASDAGTGTAITFGAGNVPNTNTDTSVSGSTAPDFSQYTNFIWTLTGNLVLTDPGDEVAGQSGIFVFIQDGTGSRTLSHAADQYFVAGGTSITLTTTASGIDIVPYFVQADGKIHLGAAQLAFAEA